MKTINKNIIYAAFAGIAVACFTLPSTAQAGGAVFVGHVVSLVNGGTEAVMVVEPSRYDNTGMTLRPYSSVYVYANFGNAVDGDKFKFIGDSIGTMNYTTVLGAQATVQGFRGQVVKILPGQTNY
jgi:hypothetical protein